jgi:hypothetical protein
MKQLIFLLALLLGITAYGRPGEVDEKILKSFKEAFPTAEKVTWYQNATQYEVVFYHQNAHCRITYNLDGAIERTERYYTVQNLAPFVLNKIRTKYGLYNVYGITEITTDASLVYYIMLEGQKRWLLVQADELGNSYVVKRLNKAIGK